MKSLLYAAATCCLLCPVSGHAVDTTPDEGFSLWKSESPNHAYFAAVRRMPERDYLWKDDLDGSRLVVFPMASGATHELGKMSFSHDFSGRVPARIEWTGDSKFIVFTTVSSGGHQPYRFTAYAYSVDRKAVRCVDTALGIVVSPDFRISSTSLVEFQTCKQDGGIDFEHSFAATLDLNTLFEHKRVRERPNQAMQPTTGRRTLKFSMTQTFHPAAMRALASGA